LGIGLALRRVLLGLGLRIRLGSAARLGLRIGLALWRILLSLGLRIRLESAARLRLRIGLPLRRVLLGLGLRIRLGSAARLGLRIGLSLRRVLLGVSAQVPDPRPAQIAKLLADFNVTDALAAAKALVADLETQGRIRTAEYAMRWIC